MAKTPTIPDLLEQWIAAFNSHDLDAHVALYLEDATLFGSVDPLQVGRDGIRAYFAGRGPHVRVRRYPAPTVSHIAPDVAVTSAHVDFADGDEPMPYRVSWTLVRRDGDWRIAHHHGSPRRG